MTKGFNLCIEVSMQEITVYGITLDDWVQNVPDKDLSYGWTQVCDKHVNEFPECMVDRDSGHGVCGVRGCSAEADHYVDFEQCDID